MNITTVVFDLGAVLIDWNPRYMYRKIMESETEIEYFLENICTTDWNEQQDAGRSFAEGTKILSYQFPKHSDYISAFYDRWEEMLGGPIEATVDILLRLKSTGNYRLIALTNWSAESFPIALERYEFLHWFEDIVVSGREMMKKPDPAIFQLMIDRYQLQEKDTVFIDDNHRNITEAAKMGFNTIWFKDAISCEEQLLDFGLHF
jgi:2-haloacid dehalogenase